MRRATTDPCLLIKANRENVLSGLVMLQVDDSLMLGDADFMG